MVELFGSSSPESSSPLESWPVLASEEFEALVLIQGSVQAEQPQNPNESKDL